jgi:serine/threonine protein kinase
LDSSSNTVIKSPHSEGDEVLIKIEKEIYERFTLRGGHEGLLRYFGPFESGIRLEFASNQGLFSYLQKHKSDITLQQRLRWCLEISQTLCFIHSSKVIHGDFKCNNIFLDGRLNSKVADFSGSSLDGSDLQIMVTASHRGLGVLNSAEGDIYALGSSFYEIMTSEAPYAGREEEEIVDLFSKSRLPETTSLGPMGDIIQGCWQGRYTSAYEVCMSIKGLIVSSFFFATIPTPPAIQKPPSYFYDFLYSQTVVMTFALSAICLFAVYWKDG